MSRTAKSLKNLAFGELQQLMNIAVSFVTRTFMVKTLGVTILGVNGVFTELIALMSLAEMGIGQAITYHLYKPLANSDTLRLAQLMNLFKTAYRIIALVILTIGVVTMPFIQLTMKDVDLDVGYIRLIYMLFVCQAAVSYLFSYKATLLTADQKAYKVARINTLCRVAFAAVTVLVLLKTHNFVAYLCAQIVYTLILNIAVSYCASKEYDFLNDRSNKLQPQERKAVLANVRFVFIGALSGKITNSTDNVLISLLDSTMAVGYYSNYQLIINSIRNLLAQVVTAAKGSIGNLLSSESNEKCEQVLRRLTYMVFIPTLICSLCLASTLSLFIGGLWYDESFMLPSATVFILVVNFFLVVIRMPLLETISASNLFKTDKNISILGSAVNLVVSIVLGVRLGMLGVFIGTVCTHVIQITLKILLLYRKRLQLPPKDYFLLYLRMLVLLLAGLALTSWLNGMIVIENVILALLARWAITIVLSCVLALAGFLRTQEYRYLMWLFERFLIRVRRRREGGGKVAG